MLARRQVHDIPPIQVMVTEHQRLRKRCGCGQWNEGQFPDSIKAPVQIGPQARSFLVYLNIAHVIPYRRLAQICQDLFHFPVSEGSIDRILTEAGMKAEPLLTDILAIIKKGSSTGSDETGFRAMAKRMWLWVWQMKQLLLRSAKARDYIWRDGVPSNRQQQIIAQYEDRLEFLIQQPLARENEIRLQERFRKGADRYATLLSIIETAKKNRNVLNTIQLLCQNQLQFNST